jgi:DNA polymerase I-like protein with 3'-5' exonuclease and polymerase domains
VKRERHATKDEIITDERLAMATLANDREIGLDLETSGLSPWRDVIAVVSMYGAASDVTAVLHVRGHVSYELREFLSQRNNLWIGHNIANFDMLFLHNAGVDVWHTRYFDTLIAEQVTLTTGRRDVRKDLASTIARRLGTELKKGQGDSSWMTPELNEAQYQYCASDVYYLITLMHEQLAKVAGTTQEQAMEFEQSLIPAIAQMIVNGMPLDVPALVRWRKHMVVEAAASNRLLHKLWPGMNVNSSAQLDAAYFGLFNFSLPMTEKGNPQANKMVLASILEGATDIEAGEALSPIGEFTKAVQIAKQERTRNNFYDDEWVATHVTADGRVHPKFWQASTDTFRFSSSDPNMQQVPREGRHVFGGVYGHSVVAVDFCLHPETLVETVYGPKRIDSLYAGDKVYSIRNDRVVTNEVVQSAAVRWLPAYRITLDNDETVIASEDHRWPVLGATWNDKLVKTTKQLVVGERMIPMRRQLHPHGYIHLYSRSAFMYTKEHKLVAEAVYGPQPEGTDLHHKNENKSDNHPSNLEYKPESDHRSDHARGKPMPRKDRKQWRANLTASANNVGSANPRWNKGVGCTCWCEVCGSRYYNPDKTVLQPKCRTCRKQVLVEASNHKITKLEYIGMQPMWAIEVTPDHNYVLTAGIQTYNSQLEVRVAAYLANDHTLIDVLTSDTDMHTAVASMIFHVDVADVTKLQRQWAKAATFTLLFGGSAMGLVNYALLRGYKLDENVAEQIVINFFRQFRGLAVMREKARRRGLEGRPVTITLASGAKRVLMPVKDKRGNARVKPSQILNTMVQSGAAIGMKHAILQAHEAKLTEFLGLTVHDELVGCVPNKMVIEFNHELQRCMIEGMRNVTDDTPIDVEAKVGTHWQLSSDTTDAYLLSLAK